MIRSVLVAALLVALVPPAAALPEEFPTPVGDTDPVTSWSMWSLPRQCSTYDDLVGLVTVTPTSGITHPDGAPWSIHLVSPLGECPSVDLTFTTGLASWPTTSTQTPLATSCGSWGTFSFVPEVNYVRVHIGLHQPAACGLPFGPYASFELWVQPIHPTTYEVCPPVPPVLNCVGVSQSETGRRCSDGTNEARFDVMRLVMVREFCDAGGERTYVFIFVVGGIVATDDSCRVYNHVGRGIPEPDCPEPVREIVRGTDWARVLP